MKAGASALLAVLSVFGGSCRAADLKALAQLLVPAYTAEDFAAVCTADNPAFLKGEMAGFGSVPAYSAHVKKEVTSGLPPAEAFRVRIDAANAARAAAEDKLRRLGRQRALTGIDPVQAWCENDVRAFVRGLLSVHDTEHSKFDAMVRAAEEPNK